MKRLLLAVLFMTSTHAIVVSPGPVIGFTDSSFNYKTQEEAQAAEFCYWGNIDTVCDEIKEGIQNRNMQYYSGAHDKIEFASCEVIEDEVVAKYSMSDDYGYEFSVVRNIDKCTQSSIIKR